MNLEHWQLLIGFLALVGPALVIVGIVVGRLTEKTNNNRELIQRHESQMRHEFTLLRSTLQDSIREAWRNCPQATGKSHHD